MGIQSAPLKRHRRHGASFVEVAVKYLSSRRTRTALAAGLAVAALAGQHAARAQTSHKPITHVIIIMQENRSFDSYFGTFPGADGIAPGTCLPVTPASMVGCVTPFHDPRDENAGGGHTAGAAEVDLHNGIGRARMDGFLIEQAKEKLRCTSGPQPCAALRDGLARHDAVGYHTAEELPNYWAYAAKFVLQDHMFEGVRGWSWPAHLDLVSEWAASCTNDAEASTCASSADLPSPARDLQLPWANLFQLMDAHGVTWTYYLGAGQEPDCRDDEMTCDPVGQTPGVPSIWNPVPYFASVKAQGADYLAAHNREVDKLLLDVKKGTLPQVSWVVPARIYSEHPPEGVTKGMEYVTSMVNAVMQSRYWRDTAIFIAWDDWGGFYDHVPPPDVDTNATIHPIQGFGLRVPGLMISAWAKPGMVDHSILSFDSYATFIENLFMNSARLDPAALGNPDNRPDIRDALTSVRFPDGSKAPIGRLIDEFDFNQTPLPPLVLSTHIPTGLVAVCNPDFRAACKSPTVTISWDPVAGPQVPGPFTYHVQRDGAELPQCVTTATSCTDKPGSGAHLYRAYSVDQDGTTSPLSAAAEADEP
jgi:phospholipase C